MAHSWHTSILGAYSWAGNTPFAPFSSGTTIWIGWYMGRNHFGIDIAGSKGSSINAAGAGIVLLSNWTPDFGNMIIISHGNGLYSYYGHAMRLLVEQGTQVRKGQLIAQMGSSGISSAAHLHFEIWKDGRPLDPEDYLFALAR